MAKKITHLGSLKGKLLVFGGVYSNLQALKALMHLAKENAIAAENCICTGDLVGYCAQPEETVQLFREWGAKSIAGNVELQLVEGADACGCDFTEGSRCDAFSKLWYPYAKERLSTNNLTWMGSLPNHITFKYAGKNVAVLHGAVDNVSAFIFESTSAAIKLNNFKGLDADLILAGHCGLPFSQSIQDKKWLNPGVIGMPANEGLSRVWCLILEEQEGNITYAHRFFYYDCETAFELMKANHLPMAYANTLRSGLWDNMEILPEAEKQLQGVPYTFNNEITEYLN